MALNHELSDLFRTLSAVLEIKGENTFKALAFSKVSRVLKDMTFDIGKAVAEDRLDQIEGIGASSRKIIEDYVKTGHSSDFDEVSASVPGGLIQMLDIPGLGPKTIALFWKERGITNIGQLVQAIDSGALKDLRGIGDKKIAAIKQGIEFASQASQRMGFVEALPIAEALVGRLREMKQVKRAEIAGSLRRGRETIGDVDLVCAPKDQAGGGSIAEEFVKFPEIERVLGQGTTKASVVTAGGLQVDLRIVPEENFGAALLYFTGSKDHNVKIRGLAQDKRMTLNEWGLYKLTEYEKAPKKTAEAPPIKAVASQSEEDVYKKLGLPFIVPELREDRGEIEAGLKGELPELIEVTDIRGDLHTHTVASDGVASIEQMAQAALERGYEYLAITDHSKSQAIANGLSVDRLLKHIAAIRKANDKIKGITLLAGSEVDILADGHLDYEDAVLKELDIVIASPHVALKQDESKATDRLLRAIENRYVTVIGHPTGRIINRREGLPLDYERLFKAASETGTALEINAGWPRLDLNDIHARGAIQRGVMLSINTDAHSTEGLGDMVLGIIVARRGWAQKKNVINCMTLAQLRGFVKKKRG